jgi:hypothetical protein
VHTLGHITAGIFAGLFIAASSISIGALAWGAGGAILAFALSPIVGGAACVATIQILKERSSKQRSELLISNEI